MSFVPLTRRDMLLGGAALGGALLIPVRARTCDEHADAAMPVATEHADAATATGKRFTLPGVTRQALDSSPLVYVSPLHPDGRESSCHGEVWFFHDGGDVVLATATSTWKARALEKGFDKARIWVGDFGTVRRAGDRFRSAPEFLSVATRDTDPATFERLMASFAGKYADEWSKWGPRFRKGNADGSRILIRYHPIAP